MFRNFAGGPAPVENLVIVSQRGLGLAPVQGRKFIRGSGENLFEPSLGVAFPASGSNGFSPCYGGCQTTAEVRVLGFHFQGDAVASNWGIQIFGRQLREWARRKKLVGGVASRKAVCGGLHVLPLRFGEVLPRGYAVSSSLGPSNLLSVSGSFWPGSHCALYGHGPRQASAPNLPNGC
jgi:hypothetical protein